MTIRIVRIPGASPSKTWSLPAGSLPKRHDRPDRLQRRPAAGEPGHRAEHAELGAGVAILGVERVADEAAIAGLVGLPAAKRADLRLELADCGRDQRHLGGRAPVGHGEPGGEIVAAIEHQIDPGEKRADIGDIEPRGNRLDLRHLD